tara:strand:+ start:96 stop:443 length:348 start_codon:yes stop_codon:yes gene_type:complete
MPSLRESNERGIGLIRKDIVLGDRFGTACHKEVTDISKIILQDLGFSVAINEPYAGAYITSHYGQPKSKINAIQIEINRGLYMDENSIKRLPRINDLNKLMLQFLKRLGQTMLLY